jgi:hypothetical protein
MTFADIYAGYILIVAVICFITATISSWKNEWSKATFYLVLLMWLLQIKK